MLSNWLRKLSPKWSIFVSSGTWNFSHLNLRLWHIHSWLHSVQKVLTRCCLAILGLWTTCIMLSGLHLQLH